MTAHITSLSLLLVATPPNRAPEPLPTPGYHLVASDPEGNTQVYEVPR